MSDLNERFDVIENTVIPVMGELCFRYYTNYKGERHLRTFRAIRIYFGSNEWHPVPGWLMDAYDNDRGEERTFALNGFIR